MAQVLSWEHYLPLMQRKPGACAMAHPSQTCPRHCSVHITAKCASTMQPLPMRTLSTSVRTLSRIPRRATLRRRERFGVGVGQHLVARLG